MSEPTKASENVWTYYELEDKEPGERLGRERAASIDQQAYGSRQERLACIEWKEFLRSAHLIWKRGQVEEINNVCALPTYLM